NFSDHIKNAVDGATIAKNARRELEQKTGKSVVSPLNARNVLGLSGDAQNTLLLSNEEEN
ncbi:MAG: hypothetical protein J6X18_04080, partial [Bacteroidales bacterium]|nr:hypothetical protein [Bacteroidales bacterium]